MNINIKITKAEVVEIISAYYQNEMGKTSLVPCPIDISIEGMDNNPNPELEQQLKRMTEQVTELDQANDRMYADLEIVKNENNRLREQLAQSNSTASNINMNNSGFVPSNFQQFAQRNTIALIKMIRTFADNARSNPDRYCQKNDTIGQTSAVSIAEAKSWVERYCGIS